MTVQNALNTPMPITGCELGRQSSHLERERKKKKALLRMVTHGFETATELGGGVESKYVESAFYLRKTATMQS